MDDKRRFLTMNYQQGEKRPKLQAYDYCIIHPVKGRSEAKESYEVMIDDQFRIVAIGKNPLNYPIDLNDYSFSRLEFVSSIDQR